jgi:septal ring factor EnvC (AmiA/AmiB activator)
MSAQTTVQRENAQLQAAIDTNEKTIASLKNQVAELQARLAVLKSPIMAAIRLEFAEKYKLLEREFVTHTSHQKPA